MRITDRRLNLAQAHKRSGQAWCSISDLKRCGAYGATPSIHRTFRVMMVKEDAAAIVKTKQGYLYRITPLGYSKLGMVPHKIQGQGNDVPGQGNPEGSPASRPARG
jgi:hypothetical protein